MRRDDLRRIAGRASTIDERLKGSYAARENPGAGDRAAAERRLASWRHSGGAGESRWLAYRLALAGTNERSAQALLGTVELRSCSPLPEWARAVSWVAPAIKRGHVALSDMGGACPLPFEELLWPAARAAHRRLTRRLGGKLQRLLSQSARASLRRDLLSSLCRATAPALFSEFRLFRHLARTPLGGLSSPDGAPGAHGVYDAFLADCRERFDEILVEKPALARIVGTIVGFWLDATTELVERLERDLPALRRSFAPSADRLGKVTGVETGLSDPHCGGRSVAILDFAGGTKIVYKPKDLRIDAAWAGLLRWLADRGAPASSDAPRVLAREGYGWAEFIAGTDRDPAVEDASFHRRAGALLSLAHLLQASDLHHENVIARADGPVIVDLETMLHPRLAPNLLDRPADRATITALEQVADSVLASHYLPRWAARPNGRVAEIGGLAGIPLPRHESETFAFINTDAMTVVDRDASELFPAADPPAGRRWSPADIEALVEGFSEMYSFLLAHRAELAAPDGPVARFGGLRIRAVVGPTAEYAAVSNRAARPPNLGDGADWSLPFEALGRGIPLDRQADAAWQLFAAERQALARLDIPLFSATTDATRIETCNGEEVDDALAETPLEAVPRRFARLGPDDLAAQQRLIRGALATVRSGPRAPAAEAARWPDARLAAEKTEAGFKAAAIATARRLGAILDRTAIRRDGGAAWVGVIPLDHDRATIGAVGTDLYAGVTGIALFLAALASATHDPRSRDLALAALVSARRIHAPSETGARSARRMGIGGGYGVGSVVYGLVRIAALLGEPALLDEAARMSLLLTEDRIAADRVYGVLGGAAGATLGLLALHAATGDSAVLDRAILCGRHLLAAAGSKEWRGRGNAISLTGFAQGAAGIALALAKLFTACGERVFRETAEDAIRFERGILAPAGERADPPFRWCSGAAGIGLARLGVLGLLDDAELPGEIDGALDAAIAQPPSSGDHLCCGNLGRIELLLAAGVQLKRNDLIRIARQQACFLMERSVETGGIALDGAEAGLQPGFFRGISGVGYELLRLTDPATLPSVLLWQ